MKCGEIWWTDLHEPRGSGTRYRRPVLIVQSDTFNRSTIKTVLTVALTSNTRLGSAPGNVALSRRESGLQRPSVANVSQVIALDRVFLTERVHRVAHQVLRRVDEGLGLVLGLLRAPDVSTWVAFQTPVGGSEHPRSRRRSATRLAFLSRSHLHS